MWAQKSKVETGEHYLNTLNISLNGLKVWRCPADLTRESLTFQRKIQLPHSDKTLQIKKRKIKNETRMDELFTII